MLTPETIARIAGELAGAERTRGVIPRITARYPEATVEDAYAIQGVWRDAQVAALARMPGLVRLPDGTPSGAAAAATLAVLQRAAVKPLSR